ncbi:MAG: hypothetical protein WCN98_10660 [Verrucomicrobiaceae bacterium]
MWWLIWGAVLALFVCLGVATYFVARSPSFWIGLVKQVFALAVPDILEYLKARNTPDVEKEMQACVRRGGDWDNFNKKCRDK